MASHIRCVSWFEGTNVKVMHKNYKACLIYRSITRTKHQRGYDRPKLRAGEVLHFGNIFIQQELL